MIVKILGKNRRVAEFSVTAEISAQRAITGVIEAAEVLCLLRPADSFDGAVREFTIRIPLVEAHELSVALNREINCVVDRATRPVCAEPCVEQRILF